VQQASNINIGSAIRSSSVSAIKPSAARNYSRLAPKAVISDDGDIEIESGKTMSALEQSSNAHIENKSNHFVRFQPQSISIRHLDYGSANASIQPQHQRLSMRLPSGNSSLNTITSSKHAGTVELLARFGLNTQAKVPVQASPSKPPHLHQIYEQQLNRNCAAFSGRDRNLNASTADGDLQHTTYSSINGPITPKNAANYNYYSVHLNNTQNPYMHQLQQQQQQKLQNNVYSNSEMQYSQQKCKIKEAAAAAAAAVSQRLIIIIN
jgi:hypothetical protein